MFRSTTTKIKDLGDQNPERIKELEALFDGPTNVYIDLANVVNWRRKLGWNIDPKRLKQFLNSFDNIKDVSLYSGTLLGDQRSEETIKLAQRLKYVVKTKPVKIMRLSIDVSSIPMNSPDILKDFIRSPLLKKLTVETIEFLNEKLKLLNSQGISYLEDLKCNFDVEIGRDMLRDFDHQDVQTFVLWSGDSDFHDPIKQLLADGRKVILFATSRRVAKELNELTSSGLLIFDIQKIKQFICWSRQIGSNVF